MPEVHAMLSASSSHRWLVCTPSAMLEAALPDKGSAAAEEGTKAHSLCEKKLNAFLEGKKVRHTSNIDNEMWEASEEYLDIVAEKINEARAASEDAVVYVEHKLDYSRWVPDGFGTGDCVIISDRGLEVIDFKYGKGVPVSAENNSQMRLYALGLLDELGDLFDSDIVRMTIVQPRLDSVSTEELTRQELIEWIDALEPQIQLAAKGEGERKPGEHCRFCKLRATCRALAEEELKGVNEAVRSEDLADFELAEIIRRADGIKKWLTSVEEYALSKALDGTKWPGLKVVEGRSVRKITDAEGAAKALLVSYKPEDIYKPQELQTISNLEKLVGKKQFAAIMSPFIEKPKGKPTLVPEEDKRPEMAIDAVSAADFDNTLL